MGNQPTGMAKVARPDTNSDNTEGGEGMKCPKCDAELMDFSREGDRKNDWHCIKCGYIDLEEKDIYDIGFKKVLQEVNSLARGRKTSDYGETWKRTGLMGIYIKLMIKEGRLRELVWGRKSPRVQGESIRDTLLDIAAYAVYGVLCLDEDNIEGDASRFEHLQAMKKAIVEEMDTLSGIRQRGRVE